MDPANCLVTGAMRMSARLWGGILVEPVVTPELQSVVHGRSDLALVSRPVFPENASRIFDGRDIGEVDLLKVDIDSFDCDLVAALLRVGPLLRRPPKFLYVDFNPHIPPPFLYRTTAPADERIPPFQGSSLQCFVEAAPGHALLHVELYNAVFARSDLVDLLRPLVARRSPLEAWALGYFCHPLARTLWGREALIRRLGADPRVWADRNRSLGERGASIFRCLGRLRTQAPTFRFSLTW